MPTIEMYTTASCPFCVRAKRLLKKKGAGYTDFAVDQKPELRPEMEKRASGQTSVPQIFIDDYHVGGYDDLVDLDMEGKLDEMLGLK
ncbi:glutaredoxin 3 [Thiohalomonas denitrificans]|uniref:Glutaredoxin n=1 Tax=Thiohalomonas denitrificans TaxID=415747 RepID=A0A1G5QV09_9GAMM|nr:glutaredoxin 3 [Thiohalomonas denitrificans]SCZ65091.1 glutaredoxin 3 [Thiohalomonas denitrificans]